MDKPKAIVIIPAFNEGGPNSPLKNTVKLIRQTGIPIEICVVNDSSTDNTLRIAKELGCIVVDLPKHVGKNFAYFAGIKKALSMNAPVIVSLDADMKIVPRSDLEQLINTAARASGKKQVLMARANVSELIDPKKALFVESIMLTQLSGIRSFSVPAARKLLSSRHKSLALGYGLEYFLEHFFENNMCVLQKTGFVQDRAYRQKDRRDIQYQQIDKTIRRLEKLRVAELNRFFGKKPKNKARVRKK